MALTAIDSGILVAIALLLGAIIALAFYTIRIEPFSLEVVRLDVPIEDLPASLEGLVIAHVSDLHVVDGPEPKIVRMAIDAINSASPDLTIITGDITDEGYEIEEAIRSLSRLRVRPAVAILGNHDHHCGERRASEMAGAISDLGIPVLRNESRSIVVKGGRVWLIGYDDWCTRHADRDRSMAGLGPDDRPRILLSHSPGGFKLFEKGDADLLLAGHTHGGQIYVPFLTQLTLRRGYMGFSHGRYEYLGSTVYVSRGLASVFIPGRFMRRPEVTLMTLRAAPQSDGESPAVSRVASAGAAVGGIGSDGEG